MHIAIAWGRNHEQQVGGLPVGRLVIDPVGDGDCGKRGTRDGVGLCVRDGHALADGSGPAGLAGKDRLAIRFYISQIARTLVQRDELLDCIGLRRNLNTELDCLGGEQVNDSHTLSYLVYTERRIERRGRAFPRKRRAAR